MSDTFNPPPVTLTKAIEAFFEYPEYAELADSTRKNKRQALSFLVDAAPYRGDTYVGMLTQEHFIKATLIGANAGTPEENDRRKAAGRAAKRTRCTDVQKFDRATLRQFAQYLRIRGWQVPWFDPLPRLTGSKKVRGAGKAEVEFIKEENWDKLLDAAGARHPKNRMAIAVGLYLGRRVSEAVRITWGGIDTKEGETHFLNVKRGKESKVPYDRKFAEELKNYKTWFESLYGPVQPEWYLIPAKFVQGTEWPEADYIWVDDNGKTQTKRVDGKFIQARVTAEPSLWPLRPEVRSRTESLERDFHAACEAAGIVVSGGYHILRHSCAEATHTVDPTGRLAQVKMDHSSFATTLKAYSSFDAQYKRAKELIQAKDPKPENPGVAERDSQDEGSASRQPSANTVVSLEEFKARRRVS